MTDAQALAAVERAARGKIADGLEAVVGAAAAAEEAAIRDRPLDGCHALEAAVEDMVQVIAAEAFGSVPERFERPQRWLLRRARAHERGTRVLRKARIAAPTRSGCAPNDLHLYWLDEAGLWEQLKHLFRLAETERLLSERAYGEDGKALDRLVKHARELANALSVLQQPTRKRALASVLYRIPVPDDAMFPKPAHPDGRKEDAASRGDAERAAKLDELARVRRSAEVLAAAAKRGLIGDGRAKAASADRTLLTGLSEAFEMYTGRRATFTPKSATQRISECILFVQAAYSAFSLEPPTDAKLVSDHSDLEKAAKKAGAVK